MATDLSKAPEGATHYNSYTDLFYKKYHGVWLIYKTLFQRWEMSLNEKDWHDENLTPISDVWTIFNNDKPLSKLTDEQAAELFNHWCKGGAVEYLYTVDGTWADAGITTVNANATYRAKQKSECVLFIEAAAKVMFEVGGGEHQINDITLGALFKAGFKAPKRTTND